MSPKFSVSSLNSQESVMSWDIVGRAAFAKNSLEVLLGLEKIFPECLEIKLEILHHSLNYDECRSVYIDYTLSNEEMPEMLYAA
jgi:hypothetical protein